MSYRLFAFDLDGTAIVSGQQPTSRVLAAVRAAQERGVHMVVATGRPYMSGLRYARTFGVHAPLICYQGALVKAVNGSDETLYVSPLATEPLAELIAAAEARDLELTLYTEQYIYLTVLRHPREFYDLWFGLTLRQVPRLGDALDLMAVNGETPLKALFIGDVESNDRVTPELAGQFAGRLDIIRSHSLFIEALTPGISKASALAFLAQRLGVAQHETIAAGDAGNDVSMVAWAGLGVAMANASPDVHAVADWVAPHVDDDGLATVIERFILNADRKNSGAARG